MKSKIKLLVIYLFIVSCNTIKPYERVNINDSEMQLSAKKTEKHETNFQVYREGASGANGGKSGGGCGCN